MFTWMLVTALIAAFLVPFCYREPDDYKHLLLRLMLRLVPYNIFLACMAYQLATWGYLGNGPLFFVDAEVQFDQLVVETFDAPRCFFAITAIFFVQFAVEILAQFVRRRSHHAKRLQSA